MLPTVRITSPITDQNPLGFIVINESDFDASQHELFGAAPKAEAEAEAEASRPLGIKALRDELTARGIAFDAEAKKADLQSLLDQNQAQ